LRAAPPRRARVENACQLRLVRLDGGCERAPTGLGEGDARGAAVVWVGLAADQPGTLDPVCQLAGAAHGDPQRLGEVTDPLATVG